MTGPRQQPLPGRGSSLHMQLLQPRSQPHSGCTMLICLLCLGKLPCLTIRQQTNACERCPLGKEGTNLLVLISEGHQQVDSLCSHCPHDLRVGSVKVVGAKSSELYLGACDPMLPWPSL